MQVYPLGSKVSDKIYSTWCTINYQVQSGKDSKSFIRSLEKLSDLLLGLLKLRASVSRTISLGLPNSRTISFKRFLEGKFDRIENDKDYK